MNEYDAETLAGLAELNKRGVSLPIELSQASPEVMRFNVLQRLKALPPRVQILHVRDPDNECSVEVWLDGVKCDSVSVEDLDPGRGWVRSEWNERIEEATEDTSDYGKAVLMALNDIAENSKWIDEDRD